jgi:hypothetical protein
MVWGEWFIDGVEDGAKSGVVCTAVVSSKFVIMSCPGDVTVNADTVFEIIGVLRLGVNIPLLEIMSDRFQVTENANTIEEATVAIPLATRHALIRSKSAIQYRRRRINGNALPVLEYRQQSIIEPAEFLDRHCRIG